MDGRVRAVILDFGGVMTEPIFRRAAEVDPELAALIGFFVREAAGVYAEVEVTHDLHLLETGRLTEAEFFANLCHRYEEAGNPPVAPERARAALFGRGITPCAEMIDAVRGIRAAGYGTALLTNNAREWEAQWRASIPVDELFDTVVDSSAVGLRKPDPRIFLLTCERLTVEPQECVFVDDIASNVDAAAALGMEAVLCADPVATAAQLLERLHLGDADALEAAS